MENLEPSQQLCVPWGKSLYINSAANRVHSLSFGVLLSAEPKQLQELLAGACMFHSLLCCCVLEQKPFQELLARALHLTSFLVVWLLAASSLLMLLPFVRVVSWVCLLGFSNHHCSLFFLNEMTD